MPSDDVERFNAWAPRYERGWMQKYFFSRIHARVLKLAADLVPAPRRTLDVGCGTGAFLRAAAAQPILAKNEQVTVLERRGEWYRIKTEGGVEGWVRWRYVDPDTGRQNIYLELVISEA